MTANTKVPFVLGWVASLHFLYHWFTIVALVLGKTYAKKDAYRSMSLSTINFLRAIELGDRNSTISLSGSRS